jgi:hypothetical protein
VKAFRAQIADVATVGVSVADVAIGAAGLAERPELSAAAVRRLAWWAALVTLCAMLLVPLFVVDVPPLVDYPNHLGRAFVLASLPGDAVLGAFYAAHWAIIPNLAIDLIAPPLMHVLPVHDVGRLLIAAAVLLPVLGTVAYSTALGGRWWCLGVALVAYNGTLLQGFLNFSLSVGVALLLASSWLRWREVHPLPTIALNAAGAVVLFTCHLMGLLFFAVLIAAAELSRLIDDRSAWRVFLRSAAIRGGVLALIFAVPAALYAMSELQALGDDGAFLSPLDKLIQLLTPFINYSLPLDVVTGIAALALPCICLLLRKGRLPGPAAMAIGVLMIAYAAAPYAWKGTSQLDTRFAIMLGFMLFAGFVPVGWPLWLRRTGVAVAVVLVVGRMGLLTLAWSQHGADIANLRLALAPVLPGQAVYVVSVAPEESKAYWAHAPWSRRLSNDIQTDSHLGALALIERRAWWPFEFDNPSQQPMSTKEPYRSFATRGGGLPDQAGLLKANLCGFDVVLLTQADAAPDLPQARFRLLVRAGFAALYATKECRPVG